MDKVVHFEIPVDNLERAKKFYKTAFDWALTPMPQMEYTLLNTVDVDEKNMPKESGAINGGMMKRGDVIKNVVITISVENMDAVIKKSAERRRQNCPSKDGSAKHGHYRVFPRY